MGVKINMTALFLVLAANVLHSSYGRTYTVGDSTGWAIPTNNTDFYDDWADNKIFVVGDVLVFNFTAAQHNVAEVTEAAYGACSTANTIFTVNNGPARITLNRTGEHYFICAVPGHCSAGQKLNIEVRNGTNTTTSPTPRPSPVTPGTPNATTPRTSSPPRANSASPPVATFSPVFFMSIALVLLW